MVTVKRYWTFIYDTYYPIGGLKDHCGAFDTIEEAVTSIKADSYTLAHHEVWDIENMVIVWKNGEAQ